MKNTKIISSTIIFFGLFGSLLWSVFPTLVRAEENADEVKEDIEKTEKKLKEAEKKYGALQSDLNQISSTLTSTQQAILRVQNLLSQTTQTIDQKELEINNLDQQLKLERTVLGDLLQELYLSDTTPLIEVMLAKEDIASFFQNEDGLLSTQERMTEIIDEINETKSTTGITPSAIKRIMLTIPTMEKILM